MKGAEICKSRGKLESEEGAAEQQERQVWRLDVLETLQIHCLCRTVESMKYLHQDLKFSVRLSSIFTENY